MKKIALLFALTLASVSPVGATPISYSAILSGAAENPSNASTATGFATVVIDTMAHTLDVQVAFSGLTAPATAAHIHCCIAAPGNVGVATQTPTFTGFPNSTSGTYSRIFDTTLSSTFNGTFVINSGGTVAGAEAALANGLLGGNAYLNIHDSNFPGGEIRGFLTPTPVPEPATPTLLGLGLVALAVRRRRKPIA